MKQNIISFVFYVRGVIWAFTLMGAILWKYLEQGHTTMSLFLTGAGIVLLVELFRVYCAGYLHGRQPVTKVQAQFLCRTGPFAHVRNPLYMANMVRGIGVSVAINEWYAYALFIGVNVLVYAVIIPHEERFLADKFGDIYQEYSAVVRRFIPTLRGYPFQEEIIPSFHASLRSELHTITFLIALLALIYVSFLS